MENFKKGSIWRKWDLHIHAPSKYTCAKNDNYDWDNLDEKIEKFIEELKWLTGMPVVWITDYFSLDAYKNVIKHKEELKNITLILPNIEFRITPETSDRRKINLHILFNPAVLEIEEIERFLYKFEFPQQRKNLTCREKDLIQLWKNLDNSLSNEEAFKKGLNEFSITYQEFFKVLKEQDETFKENILIGVSNNSTDWVSGIRDLPWIRNIIYEWVDFIFSAQSSDRDYFLWKSSDTPAQIIKKYTSLKPCIHWSDYHWGRNGKKIGIPDLNRFCWIKWDLTFEALKYIRYEPEERVFIGEHPEILEKVNTNKTKYIQSLEIDQVKWYDGKKGFWFKGQKIEFNKELVAIIGNKWSWKSALADIIGFLWNTHNGGRQNSNFSFLNKERFMKSNLANNFEWTLIWEDGEVVNQNLWNWEIKAEKVERVRYLPQNYFNNLTNEIENDQFTQVLENVIFNHLEDSLRLWKSSFKELREYKTQLFNQEIIWIKEKIKKINVDILNLERRKQKEEIHAIQEKFTLKEREVNEQKILLEALEKNQPKNPHKDEKIKIDQNKKFQMLEDLNKENYQLDSEIEDIKNQRKKLEIDKQELKILQASLEKFDQDITTYKENCKGKYENLWIDMNKILKLNVNYTLIHEKIKEIDEKIEKIKKYLISSLDIASYTVEEKEILEKESLLIQKEIISQQIEDIKKDLSKVEVEYQKYLETKEKLSQKILEITWDVDIPDTLKFYEYQIEYLTKQNEKTWMTKIEEELQLLKQQREEYAIKIFNEKQRILELYQHFKKPIDEKVDKNEDFLDPNSKINVDVKFIFQKDFIDTFLRFINQGKRWSFSGKIEWQEVLKEIILNSNINLGVDSLKSLLMTFLEYLEYDKRAWQNNEERSILQQVFDIQSFYDYLFSLDYIDISYELKAWEKTLQELSPGEKWTVLLIFYLMIDKEEIPLIIDQPEDNLDNQSVFRMLSNFIKKAKKKRQIIIVTHNPNLAVWADAEQIIYTYIDKVNNHKFGYESWSIENPSINKHIVDILEGTMPAFDKRKLKYQNYSE